MVTSLAGRTGHRARGGTLTIEQRVRIRRNHGFAGADLGRGGQRAVRRSPGAAAADEKNRVQRFWRDANAAAVHASLDWDTLSALYGTQQLGSAAAGRVLATPTALPIARGLTPAHRERDSQRAISTERTR